MFKNFIVVVLRNLKSRSLYSFINISGLSMGIICSLLIMLWVMDEFSFNKFIPKYDRLHQVWINADLDGSIQSWTTTPLPLYEVLKTADHRIENVTITDSGSDHVLRVGDTRVLKQGRYVSEEFLEMFEYPLIKGKAESVLDETYSIVITASTAKALFGDADPIDKMLKIDDQHSLKVTGVMEDVPENSTFQFDYLLTWRFAELTNSLVHYSKGDWSSNLFYLFMELKEGASHQEVSNAIKDGISNNYTGNFKQELFLYPMEQWRLYGHFEDGNETGDGLIEYINLFLVIASLVLIIASVNFMNLMTAQSEKSSKEVGIRKTLGASRGNLISRFLGEAFVATFIAFLIALLITFIVLPYYNDLVEKNLSLDLTSGPFWLVSIGILVFTAFISGSYPAFYLSAFNPLLTMKGKIVTGKGTFRKILTVMQLGTAILLMAGTLVIFQQINLMKERDLGYLKDRLITVKFNNEFRQNYNVIKQQLQQSGAIESMTRSSSPITNIAHNNLIDWPGKLDDQKVMFATITSEYDYTKTMGIEMVQGRDFSREFPSDSNAIVFNKAAMEIMKLEDPIGTQFNLWGRKKHLIGVMDDVVMEDLEQVIRPLFVIFEDWGGVVTIRLNSQMELQAALDKVGTVLERFNPSYPFDYEFVDVAYDEKFKEIGLIQKLAGIFTFLAISITCLGLFGLISYTAEQRTKEIGIRKVLGASATNLILLITRDFTFLVLIAFVIAGPISWWLLDDFLEKYPIRVSVAWWLIPLTSIVTLVITLLIVVSRANRASKIDPVITLKSE